jgi:hypothetical protein
MKFCAEIAQNVIAVSLTAIEERLEGRVKIYVVCGEGKFQHLVF